MQLTTLFFRIIEIDMVKNRIFNLKEKRKKKGVAVRNVAAVVAPF